MVARPPLGYDGRTLMEIVVRSVSKGRFLGGNARTWTTSADEARAFKRTEEAVQMAGKMLDLSDVELVFRQGRGENMIIRLSESGSSVVKSA